MHLPKLIRELERILAEAHAVSTAKRAKRRIAKPKALTVGIPVKPAKSPRQQDLNLIKAYRQAMKGGI